MPRRGSFEWLAAAAMVIAVTAALTLTAPVTAPVTSAVFLIAIAWPLQSALQQRLPSALAVVLTLVISLVVLASLAGMVAWGFSRVAGWVVANSARLQEMFLAETAWFEERGAVVIGAIVQHFDVQWLVRAARQLSGTLQDFLSFTLITLVFMLLGLLEVEATAIRLARLGPSGAWVVETIRDVASKLQVYMAVRTGMSLLTGFGIWAFARATGLELALEWGVIAFAMNDIPFIGPLVATLFPTLFAGLQFGNWQMVITVFLGMNAIQLVLGSYLEPRISGRVVSVSPFAMLFAVFMGGLLWGVAGAFLGPPILIALLTFCERSARFSWLATALASGPPQRTSPR